MKIKGIQEENFNDYSKPSMLISVTKCSTQCWKKLNLPPETCQNYHLHLESDVEITEDEIINTYKKNPITQAIIFGGLDSFDCLEEVINFIKIFRLEFDDDCVLYTGKDLIEIQNEFEKLSIFKNIYVKYGGYIPKQEQIIDELTEVTLFNKGQKFIKISLDKN